MSWAVQQLRRFHVWNVTIHCRINFVVLYIFLNEFCTALCTFSFRRKLKIWFVQHVDEIPVLAYFQTCFLALMFLRSNRNKWIIPYPNICSPIISDEISHLWQGQALIGKGVNTWWLKSFDADMVSHQMVDSGSVLDGSLFWWFCLCFVVLCFSLESKYESVNLCNLCCSTSLFFTWSLPALTLLVFLTTCLLPPLVLMFCSGYSWQYAQPRYQILH